MRRALVVALVALVVTAACGSDRTADVEDAIEDLLDADSVSCPEGDVVECTVVIDGIGVELPVTIGEDDEVTMEAAVVVVDEVVAYLEDELTEAAVSPVEVDCGDVEVLVRSVGETLPCTATRESDNRAYDVPVEVIGLDGEIRYTATRIAEPTP